MCTTLLVIHCSIIVADSYMFQQWGGHRIYKMELTVYMVVLALMHNLHPSALFSLAYMPNSVDAAGRGMLDASLTLPSSENEKEVGVCVCVCVCVVYVCVYVCVCVWCVCVCVLELLCIIVLWVHAMAGVYLWHLEALVYLC